jgi:hypothetical protein
MNHLNSEFRVLGARPDGIVGPKVTITFARLENDLLQMT